VNFLRRHDPELRRGGAGRSATITVKASARFIDTLSVITALTPARSGPRPDGA
jgi:hypothetical protein